jgi:hypothetical protein
MTTQREHVVIQDSALLCEHCGHRYPLALPMPIEAVIAAARTFSDIHRHCDKPEQKGAA